jgi:hypothetical protein
MANGLSPVVYDVANRELRTVTGFFPPNDLVVQIRWEDAVSVNANVRPGQLLATIVWNSGRSAPITAPAGCTGRITYQNRKILYEVLSEQSLTLLRLT